MNKRNAHVCVYPDVGLGKDDENWFERVKDRYRKGAEFRERLNLHGMDVFSDIHMLISEVERLRNGKV